MKKYLLIITAALLTGLTSCVDLDLYPLEELSDGSFWKTPKDAEMAVSDLYPSLPYWVVDDDINSDNAVHGIKWAAGNISKEFMTRWIFHGADHIPLSVRPT